MPFSFRHLAIPELMLITPRRFPDDRGYFMETYKKSEFRANGIDAEFVQDNHSFSAKGVLRGLHFQRRPHTQGKLVRVVDGRIWDVAVDVRQGSPTYRKWVGVELSGDTGELFWIPPGFAHGFLALSDSVHLLYKCTAEYNHESEGGIAWDDPEIGVRWPFEAVGGSGAVIRSPKDAGLKSLAETEVFA